MKVTVVHLPDVLMERQLDQAAARMLRKELESRGLQFIFKGVTKEIFGKGRVQGVRLEGGQELTADLVVMAVGIRPNFMLAPRAGGPRWRKGLCLPRGDAGAAPVGGGVGGGGGVRGRGCGLVG